MVGRIPQQLPLDGGVPQGTFQRNADMVSHLHLAATEHDLSGKTGISLPGPTGVCLAHLFWFANIRPPNAGR